MKSFSLPFNLQLNPPIKKALSKRLSLNLASSFPPTKSTKKDFASNPPKNENFMKGLKSESSGDQQKKDQTLPQKKSSKKKRV
ncbi:hypothetical protein BTM150_12080 [Helicobacter pylori]